MSHSFTLTVCVVRAFAFAFAFAMSQIGSVWAELRLGSNLLSGAQGFLEALPTILHTPKRGHYPLFHTLYPDLLLLAPAL